LKTLLLGDSCKDIYIYGKCDRLCPAAPVPIFVPMETTTNAGMAGNVYENLLTLGLDVDFITNSEDIKKIRYVDKKTNQMIVRVDEEVKKISRIENLETIDFSKYQSVVVSDYNKGFLLEDDIEFICKNHPAVFIDTKKLLGEWCKDSLFIKINEYEYKTTKHLVKKWAAKKLIVTHGPGGCTHNKKKYSVPQVEVKNICGAGDTFLSGLVAEYEMSTNIDSAIKFANECSTEVVQSLGVSLPNNFKGKYKK
jgi:bifunctional ADP-heptose synthase (sugar kinase/adenylyltransferase)